MQETIKKIKMERDGLVEAKLIKNSRGETFARASFLDPKSRKARLYMSSAFEIKVLKLNEKNEHHLLIDTSVHLRSQEQHSLNYNMIVTF